MKIVTSDGVEVQELDLGIVPVNESKEFTFILVNDQKCELIDISIKVDHPEVELLKYPKQLDPESSGELVIKWSPTLELKEGLRTTLDITATELWR